jgi:hypothetical protein
MPMFTLHRKFTLRTTKGHVVGFIKDEPVWVPPVCVHDAIAIGAVQVDGDKVDNLGDVEQEVVAMSPAERRIRVFEAFRVMKGRAERMDFTASGVPNAKRLPAITGFEITSRERDDYWKEFRTLELEAQEAED